MLGKVTSVQSYGAFLSVGEGVDGLLHVSQISNDRVDTVANVLSVGDQLKVNSYLTIIRTPLSW